MMICSVALFGVSLVYAAAPMDARTGEIVETRCALCHGREGESASAVYPRLAAQHPDYLVKQLKEFVKRERTNDNAIMHSVATKLTELELRAVSVYLGGLQ